MFKVLIVEDEAGPADYLQSIIESSCPDYSVAGIAEHGSRALELVDEIQPDLIITDVKMPVMDGITLVKSLKNEYPNIPVLIVSGHQDFEYARSALDTGVIGYLIKPVKPQQLRDVLSEQKKKLLVRKRTILHDYLVNLVHSGYSDKQLYSEKMENEKFRIALFRIGARPSYFNRNSIIDLSELSDDRIHSISGRDSGEKFFITTDETITGKYFEWTVREFADQCIEKTETIIFSGEETPAVDLNNTVKRMYKELDSLIIPGKRIFHSGKVSSDFEYFRDPVLFDKLNYSLDSQRPDLLKKTVMEESALWQRKEYSYMVIEIILRKILHHIINRNSENDSISMTDIEHLLEDRLSATEDYRGITEMSAELAVEISGMKEQSHFKPETPVFFTEISHWIEENYKKPLTLAIVSEKYHISPSYLSKLFRKYGETSFCGFLNTVRISAAKRIMTGSGDILLKDVAEMAGFNDPYYFSRVFKNVTGMSPSEYSRSIDPE